MCGRFTLAVATAELAGLFDARPANDLPPTPDYNICPTVQVNAVVAHRSGTDEAASWQGRRLVSMRWGFVPYGYASPAAGPLLINARSETIATKPAFREAARRRRCLIPASGFYEWTRDGPKDRIPWYVYPADDGDLFAFAGIWQHYEGDEGEQPACAIVTTCANLALSRLHHRMPVIIRRSDWGKWLGEEGRGAALLMQPALDASVRFHRVGSEVNSNRARGKGLIVPLIT